MKKIRIKLIKGGVKIIKRTILSKITDDLKNWPVVLITGARQVGKTTICNILEKELDYNYISLDNTRNRFDALNDPDGFLETHPWPLIIDEVQYVPGLFDVIEGIVNEQKRQTGNNNGMYILTSSESYKRPKIYFNDTGLACYLARINSPLILQNSYLSGRFVETYIINEIIKSYKNSGTLAYFYYYRDIDQKEIDLVINVDGKLNFVECKSVISYSLNDIKGFNTLANKTNMPIGFKCIICLTNSIYSLDNDTYAIPIASI